MIFSFLFQTEIAEINVSVQYKPTLIFTKSLPENCATFEVFDYGESFEYYHAALSNRDNGSFYYTDEDNQEIIIQKKAGDDQYHLRYVFVAHKKTYEIILKSCLTKLASNKKELHLIHQKIIQKEL